MGQVRYFNQVDTNDFMSYLAATETQQHTILAGAFAPQVQEYFQQRDGAFGGALPWAKANGCIALRGGEVSIWAGINGHGKSALLGQVIVGLLRQGEKACIASFEMLPAATIGRMVRQITRGSRPTDSAILQSVNWLNDKGLWIYDQQGTVQPETMTKLAHYCHDKLGVKHLVIDSLMKVSRGEDDYNGQKEFVDELCSVARHTRLHIHLVHHVRKGSSEDNLPGKFDLKGSGSITDQADNVFIVWRRKEAEDGKPDAFLSCVKQRHGDWEGNLALWCHGDSLQFVPDESRRVMDLCGGQG